MEKLRRKLEKPLGQALLATLLFCFIFVALFAGLYKAGRAYLLKEKSRRAVNLTALTGGAVYANGLEMVRLSNGILMMLVGLDLWKAGMAAAPLLETPPLALAAAYEADQVNARTPFQKFQDRFFGVESPGLYPLLIGGQTAATGGANQLSFPPIYAYNHETADLKSVLLPNMALRFRRASDFLPEAQKGLYSLRHDGIKHFFGSEQVEPAHNPQHPAQMRVKKFGSAYPQYAGWWVKKESAGGETRGEGPLSKIDPKILDVLREFLAKFKMDVTDRDDPPCHTLALVGGLKGNIGGREREFYDLGETRVDSDGLAAANFGHSFGINLEKVDPHSFPLLREVLAGAGQIPGMGQIQKGAEMLDGL